MIDCYRLLGVSPHASQDEIRSAYIARMKVLHPDAGGGSANADAAASEISAAYWQLRTRDRRSEHDRHLFASTSLARPNSDRHVRRHRLARVMRRRRPPPMQRREHASRVLIGAAVGILVLALATPAGLFWLAHLNPIEPARASASPILSVAAADIRRPLDAPMRAAAADDFATVVRDFGLKGALTFSRQCLAELPARASMAMLDYCIAFDDAAANWERSRRANQPDKRLFSDEQRSSQYRDIAASVRDEEVGRAMLQEAGFFSRRRGTSGSDAAATEFSAL